MTEPFDEQDTEWYELDIEKVHTGIPALAGERRDCYGAVSGDGKVDCGEIDAGCRRDNPVRPVRRFGIRLRGGKMMMAWLIVVDQWLETATDIPLPLLGTVGAMAVVGLASFLSGEALVMRTLRERDAPLEELWKQFGMFLWTSPPKRWRPCFWISR